MIKVTNKAVVKIKRISNFRLFWFTKLNMLIHEEDPIFKVANETFCSKLKFRISFAINLAKQHKYILLEKNRVAGALSIEKKKFSIFIYAIGVLKEHRRKGFGTKLLLFTEDLARKFKKKFITFSVLLANKPAITMYEKNGYQSQGIGLTLIRVFIERMSKGDSESNISINISLQPLKRKNRHAKLFYWWLEEIEFFAGKEARILCESDSLLEFDFKSKWHFYEIFTENQSSGILVVIPSEFIQSMILFSNPTQTWNKVWLAKFLKELCRKTIIPIKLDRTSVKESNSNKLNQTLIQIFVTQQHKESILKTNKEQLSLPSINEDRQIYFKNIN